MGKHSHAQAVPLGALLGAGFLMIGTLGLAAGARSARLAEAAAAPPEAPAIQSAEVRFEDRPDGTLAVLDAKSGREVTEVAAGSNNFIRGVLRGMFRGRKLESLGHDGVFTLARQANGRLTLEDPETKRRVKLDSFGPTNAGAFEGLLAAATRAP